MTKDVEESPTDSAESMPLTTQQATVLQAIYDYFREHGTWPTFITIDRPIRREHGWDTAAIVLSLPESMIVHPRQGLRPIASDELRLRLLGILSCRGSSDDTDRFVRLLRYLAEREMTYEPEAGIEDDAMPRITSAEVGQYLSIGDADQLALQRLYTILQLDNWGLAGASGSGEDGWYVTLGQDIWRFRDVQTVEDCIAAREAWLAEGRSPVKRKRPALEPEVPQSLPEFQPAPSAPSPYVDRKIVEAIRTKAGQSKFEVTKLLGLIDELNDNYARRNTYASHALLRAILDHIPPIFGYTRFREVANNHSWGQTDERYIKRLANFRDQADDALHRQISPRANLLDFDDMPASVCVDQLLQECADQL